MVALQRKISVRTVSSQSPPLSQQVVVACAMFQHHNGMAQQQNQLLLPKLFTSLSKLYAINNFQCSIIRLRRRFALGLICLS